MKKNYLLILLSVLLFGCSSDNDDYEEAGITKIEILNPTSSIFVGGTYDLTVNHTPKDLEAPSYTWTSSDESIATVDNTGKINVLKVGTVKITASVASTKLTSSIEITTKPIEATSIKLNTSSKDLFIGDKFTLVATVEPQNVTSKDITWSSSDETIATVKNGEIVAISTGTVVVKAAIGSLTTECTVVVNTTPITSIKLNKNKLSLYPNSSETLTVTVEPTNAVLPNITWISSDITIATVENGIVKAIAPGNATIIAKTEDGKFEASCDITVNPIELLGITLSTQKISLAESVKSTLNYTIDPANANDVTITATSSDNSIATYDVATKTVTAHKEGTATIIIVASTKTAKFEAKCEVTVQGIINLLGIKTKTFTGGSMGALTQASDIRLTLSNNSDIAMSNVKYGVKYLDENEPTKYVNVGIIQAKDSNISIIASINGLYPYIVVKFSVDGKEYTKEMEYDVME